MTRLRTIAITVAVAAAALLMASALAPAVAAQEQTLDSCDDITEGGTYQVTDDIEQVDGSGAASCVEVRTDEDVVIEGNGYSIQGNGQNPNEDGNSYGILVNSQNPGSGDVVVRDVTIDGWDVGVDPGSSSVRVEQSTLSNNGIGVEFENAGVVLVGVTASGNDLGLQGTAAALEVRDSRFVGNGDGATVLDGDQFVFENTEFSNNDGHGFQLQHMTFRASLQGVTVEDNGGPGVSVVGQDSNLYVDDSVITGNGGGGIDGTSANNQNVYVNDTVVRDNAGDEIATYTGGTDGATVHADGVEVGDGVAVSTDGERLNVDAESSSMATDAVTLDGSNLAVSVTFTVGAERGELFEAVGGDWQSRGEYATTGGSFQETLGSGTWAADQATEATPTPTPTETESATPTETAAPPATPTETAAPPSTPQPTPTETDTPQSGGGGGSGGFAGGGGSAATATPTETPVEATATDTPEQGTATATRTETPGEATENETADNGTADNETDLDFQDGSDVNEPDEDDGGTEIAGLGLRMFGLGVAIVLLLATLAVALVRWNEPPEKPF